MALITLRTFDNSFEAHLLKTKLESENITCFLFDENLVSLNPLYNITVGGIKLKINKNQLQEASFIVEQMEETKLTDEQNTIITCPKCDSEELHYGFKSMRSTRGIFSAITSFLFMIFPIYYKTVHKCKSCGTEFN